MKLLMILVLFMTSIAHANICQDHIKYQRVKAYEKNLNSKSWQKTRQRFYSFSKLTLSEFSTELARCRTNIYDCKVEAALYDRASSDYKANLETLIEVDRKKITVKLNKALDQLKRLLLRRLEKFKLNYPSTSIDHLIEKVEQVKLITSPSETLSLKIKEGFETHCGVNGLAIQGFQITLERPTIVICPGTFLGSSSPVLHNILLIAHELAHIVDFSRFPNAFKHYMPALNCVRKFNDDRYSLNAFYLTYFNEITSDLVSMSLFKEFIAQNNLSEISESILDANVKSYCDTEDDGKHPSGDYRINSVFQANCSLPF